MQNPEFIVYAGPMMSSKTSRLLAQLERYKYQKKHVLVFKPSIDSRFEHDKITSHIGLTHPAVVISNCIEIYKNLTFLASPPDVIAIDEAFMIDGIADVLISLYCSGISVVVSTLDLSAKNVPFKEVYKMLVWATDVVKCSAVCTVCGDDAHFTHKKVVNDDEIEIGGSELYEPRCLKHTTNLPKI